MITTVFLWLWPCVYILQTEATAASVSSIALIFVYVVVVSCQMAASGKRLYKLAYYYLLYWQVMDP